MKQGSTVQELAEALKRIEETKVDYIAPRHKLEMTPEGVLHGINGGFTLSPLAHDQLAGILGIPAPYYRKMQESAKALMADNVNHWLKNGEPGKRQLFRALGHETVRAVLSERYRRLDNFDLANTVLEETAKEGYTVASCAITDTRLYLKIVSERLTGEVKPGDVVQGGIVVSNSEVGLGSVRVEPFVYRLVCTNGLVATDKLWGINKTHLGKALGEGDEIRELLSDEARIANDKAFWLTVRDVVKAAFNEEGFRRIVETMRHAGQDTIPADASATEVVNATARAYSFTEKTKENILTHLLRGGDMTRYGLLNAVTRSAEDEASYEEATRLERVGGEILGLNFKAWRNLITVN